MKILFQGDSITDAGRDRAKPEHLGRGYPHFAAGVLDFEEPGKYEILNRGVGGNRIVDVYARIKSDIINLQPDMMSLLIGVNDVWHEFSRQNGVDAEKFEKIYDMLLSEVKAALPNIKLMLMGAYILPGPATEDFDYPAFRAEVEKRAAIAKKLAEKYNCAFVDLQAAFDEAAARGPVESFTKDGVHPCTGGIELIKRAWLDAFKKL